MILSNEIKHAEPVVLRYAAGASDDYKSILARVITNTVSTKVDAQFVTAFCDIVESMSQKSYIVNLYGNATFQIKSSAPEFTGSIVGTALEACKVGGMQYGTASPILLTPYHIGLMSPYGEVLATCPVRMYLYILSRALGYPVSLEDVVTDANPFLPDYYVDSIEFITDSLSFANSNEEEVMQQDMRLMLNYILQQDENYKCYARFIWVDGCAIPISIEGHVEER